MFKSNSIKKLFSVVLVAAVVLIAAGCEGDKKEVKLGVVNWAEGIAMTNLAKVVLEDEMGYEVEVTTADVGPIFQDVVGGGTDAFMDTWLPLTHKEYMDKYADDVEVLGTNFEGAKIGLVVPKYVYDAGVTSIEDLNAESSKFDGEIIGIDAGAGIMSTTETAMTADNYNLSNFELMASSGPAMTASLKDAIDNDEWVVVTGWNPHWKFAEWELKFLDDPKGIYGSEEVLKTIARKDLKEDMPEVAEFLANFEIDIADLGDLMGEIANAEDKEPEEVAREWKNENMDLINTWLPEEK